MPMPLESFFSCIFFPTCHLGYSSNPLVPDLYCLVTPNIHLINPTSAASIFLSSFFLLGYVSDQHKHRWPYYWTMYHTFHFWHQPSYYISVQSISSNLSSPIVFLHLFLCPAHHHVKYLTPDTWNPPAFSSWPNLISVKHRLSWSF